MLKAEKLVKHFDQKRALNEVSFTINFGEVVGIIGPNGSGKTTLLNVLTGMTKPNSGFFEYQTNLDVGMAISRKGFFDDMTVNNNVKLFARVEGVQGSSVDSLMLDFNIDFGEKVYSKLSAGMKQRVSLMIPFLKRRDLILLDEPTNHLDVDSILFLRDKIMKLKSIGVSFLITSHVLTELEKVCDRILFVKNGKVISNITSFELVQSYVDLEEAYLNILNPSRL